MPPPPPHPLLNLAYQHGQTLADWTYPQAEFSTLEVAACHAMHLLHSIAVHPNLELNTQPKQILGSLLLDISLPITGLYKN